MKKYVYDGTEVVTTGRVAIKQIKTAAKIVTDTLIEIKPADPDGPSWKKWVRQTDLYEIQEAPTK